MSNKKISYLNRNFEDYREALINYVKEYYPQIAADFNDASIGSWLIDVVASVADNLSFYIDKTYSETNVNTAQQASSVYALARNAGFKVPGPVGSIAEVEFTCEIPIVDGTNNTNGPSAIGLPNRSLAPIIKKGTKLASANQYFEVMEDVDMGDIFNEYKSAEDTQYFPVKDSNGHPIKYRLKKRATVVAGETKIYKQVLTASSVKPFMEVIIPEKDIINIESIIFKDGGDYKVTPTNNEFMQKKEFVAAQNSPSGNDTYRYFEVDSLIDQYRWADDVDDVNQDGSQVSYEYNSVDESGVTHTTMSVTKGKWTPIRQKFITEYTNNGYLKITFGGGMDAGQLVDTEGASNYAQYQISKMINNNCLGVLPHAGWTMYIMYRVGGGAASNVPAGSINRFAFYNVEIGENCPTPTDARIIANIRNSLTVTNVIPSITGKNAPTVDEIRAMIKYNSGAQERCVTLKDYESRVLKMPARYGVPFRVRAIEENNKVVLYMLGIDSDGRLSTDIPYQMANNISNYLTMYRSINDLVEIKKARIINVSFEIKVFIDKNYNTGDVVKQIRDCVKNYMDINKQQLGDDIFVGDIQSEIQKVDGVINVCGLEVWNEYGDGYSGTETSQEVNATETDRSRIDLEESRYILNSEPDEMFEIKYPKRDIKVIVVNTR